MCLFRFCLRVKVDPHSLQRCVLLEDCDEVEFDDDKAGCSRFICLAWKSGRRQPGIDVLIRPAGGSYSYLPCLGGSLFKSLPWMLEKYIQDRSLRNAHPREITQVLHFWQCPVFWSLWSHSLILIISSVHPMCIFWVMRQPLAGTNPTNWDISSSLPHA